MTHKQFLYEKFWEIRQFLNKISHIEPYAANGCCIYGAAGTMLINTDKCLLKIYGISDEMIFSMTNKRQKEEV